MHAIYSLKFGQQCTRVPPQVFLGSLSRLLPGTAVFYCCADKGGQNFTDENLPLCILDLNEKGHGAYHCLCKQHLCNQPGMMDPRYQIQGTLGPPK